MLFVNFMGRGVASLSVMVGPVSSVVQLLTCTYAIRQYGPLKYSQHCNLLMHEALATVSAAW